MRLKRPYQIFVAFVVFVFVSFLNFSVKPTEFGKASEIVLDPQAEKSVAQIPVATLPPMLKSASLTDNALQRDTAWYANEFGLSYDEAEYRLSLLDGFRLLQQVLREKEAATFGGLWLQHEPSFKVYIRFTNDGEEAIARYLGDNPLKDFVVIVKNSANSLESLIETQTEVAATLHKLNLEFDHDIKVQTGRMQIFVKDIGLFHSQLDKASTTLPATVDIIEVESLSREITDIIAGMNVATQAPGICTTGFAVLADKGINSELGISTAGHCTCSNPDTCTETWPITVSGVVLPFEARWYGGSYDLVWHDKATFDPKYEMFDGTINRTILGIQPRSNMIVNDPVCKYGRTTLFDCGTIVSKNYNGTNIRVTGNQEMGEPGDSGGPFMFGNIAYGISRADIEPGNDVYFMASNYYEDSGLNICLMRSASPATPPTLSGTLSGSLVQLSWTFVDDVCGHELHRSTEPYYSPSTATEIRIIPLSNVSYSSSVGVGNVNTNYYYYMRVAGGNSFNPTSNGVGEFDFAIVPGS